jgi:hypothetical protein
MRWASLPSLASALRFAKEHPHANDKNPEPLAECSAVSRSVAAQKLPHFFMLQQEANFTQHPERTGLVLSVCLSGNKILWLSCQLVGPLN